MMAPKIFITGATGYIGGDGLYTIDKAHPDWQITCMVRNSDKGAQVASIYPKVRLVYGDLDSTDLIEEESSKANVVYHFADCDHVPSAIAISKGLARHTADNPGFWIHTSGGMILATESIRTGRYGESFSKVFNDWEGIGELTSQPEDAAHRAVDKIVLAASLGLPHVKTAIVCPPCIYGVGRGPGNQESQQVNMATRYALQEKKGLKIGKGNNIWNEVHVHDLSDLYLLLGEAAIAGGAPATWNDQGYYLAENGEFVWGDVCARIAELAYKMNLLPSREVVSLSNSEAAALKSWLGKAIGTDSRGSALRARTLLGWKPKAVPLVDEIQSVVESEAKKLGLITGHAAKVEQ